MYALSRNAHKYEDRDKRIEKIQKVEFDFLGPDTINEIFDALTILKNLATNERGDAEITGWENSKRKTIITKVPQSINAFKQMIVLYAGKQILHLIHTQKITKFEDLKKTLPSMGKRTQWLNIGGQLIQKKDVESLQNKIKNNKINDWKQVHAFYSLQGEKYENEKLGHAYASLLELWNISPAAFTLPLFRKLLEETANTQSWIYEQVFETRKKDYNNPFRKMVFENQTEMNKVLGKLDENSFIIEQRKEMDDMNKQIKQIIKKWKL
jgi:hypothetical protein